MSETKNGRGDKKKCDRNESVINSEINIRIVYFDRRNDDVGSIFGQMTNKFFTIRVKCCSLSPDEFDNMSSFDNREKTSARRLKNCVENKKEKKNRKKFTFD